jgi:hypothetical protein
LEMLKIKKIQFVSYGIAAVISLAGCGGGGGEPTATNAAQTSTEVDLSNPEIALKVSSVLLGSSPLGPTFGNKAWTTKDWEGATRTETKTCGTATLTNSDGVVNAGDTWSNDLVNCATTGFAGVTYSYSTKGVSSIAALSNSLAPELAAWTARQTDKASGSSNWTIFVTSNNYRYEGSGTFTFEGTNDIAHAADGSQRETYTSTTTAKGTENGLAYNYTVAGDGVCSYAATTKAETCSNGKFALTGTIVGKSVNAVLTQPAPNVTEGVSTYEITQGTQKITVTFSGATGIFTITTATGTVLSARYVNLLYINGY